jgi:hypothetical protein
MLRARGDATQVPGHEFEIKGGLLGRSAEMKVFYRYSS